MQRQTVAPGGFFVAASATTSLSAPQIRFSAFFATMTTCFQFFRCPALRFNILNF